MPAEGEDADADGSRRRSRRRSTGDASGGDREHRHHHRRHHRRHRGDGDGEERSSHGHHRRRREERGSERLSRSASELGHGDGTHRRRSRGSSSRARNAAAALLSSSASAPALAHPAPPGATMPVPAALAPSDPGEDPESVASLPPVTRCTPEGLTRRVMDRRTPYGGLCFDAVPWAVTTTTSPVLPSKHRTVSRSLWGTINPCYKQYEEESDYKGCLVDHKTNVAMRAFMNPKNDFTVYAEHKFQVGNQIIMRKGGSSMSKKKE